MKIERFEDIISWQKGKVLTILIYQLFSDSNDFGIKDQIHYSQPLTHNSQP